LERVDRAARLNDGALAARGEEKTVKRAIEELKSEL
jgi:hypothetical protein